MLEREIRSLFTDRFLLPYSGRDIFHLQRVCADLRVTFVPSLDLNSSYVEAAQALEIVNQFLNQVSYVEMC